MLHYCNFFALTYTIKVCCYEKWNHLYYLNNWNCSGALRSYFYVIFFFYYYTAGSYTTYKFYFSSSFYFFFFLVSRVYRKSRKVYKDDVGEIPFSILFIVSSCYYIIIIFIHVTTTVTHEKCTFCYYYLMSQKIQN